MKLDDRQEPAEEFQNQLGKLEVTLNNAMRSSLTRLMSAT